jgi:hypothetical protein
LENCWTMSCLSSPLLRLPRDRNRNTVGRSIYTREKDVSSIFGDMVSFWYISCCFVLTACEDPPFLYIFYDSLDLCKPSENKSSRTSYTVCIIDRAGHEIPPNNCRSGFKLLHCSVCFIRTSVQSPLQACSPLAS